MVNKLNDLNMGNKELKEYLRVSANLENIVNYTFFTTANKQWKGL